MTASTNHKKRRKKRKRKSNMLVFVCVLLTVLVLGSVALAFAALQKSQPQTDEQPRLSDQSALLPEVKAEFTSQQEEAKEPEPAAVGRYAELLQNEAEMKEKNIYAKEAASPDETVLTFAGDILFDPQYAMMANLIQRGGSIEEAFSPELLELMRSADIFAVNNEFPYTKRGAPLEGKQFTFRAEPERAAYLLDMGVDVVSLANNHAYDYGEVSLLDSLDTLDAIQMPYIGAGRNLEEASRPISFIINDTRIAILAATQIERNDHPDTRGATENSAGTFRCWNAEKLLEAVRAAKQENDYVIVYIHWGTENQAQTDWAQDDQAVKLAEAGADAVIGAHPHCLQPVGYVGGVPVVYSLGNFWFNSKTLDTALAQVVIPAEGELTVRLIPAKQEDCRTRLLDGAEKSRVIEYINSISTQGYLDENGYLKPLS